MTPICRAAARLCLLHGWAPVAEAPLPDGRRADLWVLTPAGEFLVIEAKSGLRDFQTDRKWPEYRAWCDRLYFAVGLDFPEGVLPGDTGLIVADGPEAALVRQAPHHPLPPARRRSLLQRYALLSGRRLALAQDPEAAQALMGALRVE